MLRAQRPVVLLLLAMLVLGTMSGRAAAQAPADTAPFELRLPHVALHGAGADLLMYTVPADAKQALQGHGSHENRASAPPMPSPDRFATAAEDAGAAPDTTGRRQWAAGGMPAAGADQAARTLHTAEWLRIEADERSQMRAEMKAARTGDVPAPVTGTDTTSIYSSIKTNAYGKMWMTYPYKAVGKLLIYDGGAYAGYCSASVIGPKNIVVTAAHCVYDRDGGGWHDAFEFVPAYRDGAAPYGVWISNNALITLAYVNTGAPGQDVALVSLDYQYINGAWRPVSYFTGWLGRVWDYDPSQFFFAQGYPAGLDSGRFSYTCAAESSSQGETDVIAMGCDMDGGSDGGPWIYAFHPYRGWSYNFVGGVVVDALGDTMAGVRFSSENIGSLCGVLSHWDCGDGSSRP